MRRRIGSKYGPETYEVQNCLGGVLQAMKYLEDFRGQAAVVTGGASGIGRAVAAELAARGAAVTIVDINGELLDRAAAELSAGGNPAHAHAVDICDEEKFAEALASITERSGQLDIVVHCAGIVGPNGMPITKVSIDDFDYVYRVDLRGTFVVVKQALALMEPRNYGRILVFASIAGKEGNAGMCCYSATKAGVIGLVKSVGKEFAETNITVNAIAPAVIRTAMVDAMDPAQVKYMTDKIPKKRCGTLEEVSSLACWIVSKEAGFNTGCVFDLSGGRATY